MSSNTTKSYFEAQRELVLSDVSASLENVLQNLNKLNRSLEGVIAVGNEFSQVEGLWSQFENVIATAPSREGEKDTGNDTKDAAPDSEKRP